VGEGVSFAETSFLTKTNSRAHKQLVKRSGKLLAHATTPQKLVKRQLVTTISQIHQDADSRDDNDDDDDDVVACHVHDDDDDANVVQHARQKMLLLLFAVAVAVASIAWHAL